jgi:hypothetical protein
MELIQGLFKINETDKIKNLFEASLNLFLMVFLNNLNKNDDDEDSLNYEYLNITRNKNYLSSYIQDKENLRSFVDNYLIKECGCQKQDLDEKGNTYFYTKEGNETRGGLHYDVPVRWTGIGIEVIKKYGDKDLSWLLDTNNSDWVVAYHGFGKSIPPSELKKLIKIIVTENLRAGAGQAYKDAIDWKTGKKCGIGVYITPYLNVASSYSGRVNLGSKTYRIVLMVKVKWSNVRVPGERKDYWIVDGKNEYLRPYRILLIDEQKLNNYNYY